MNIVTRKTGHDQKLISDIKNVNSQLFFNKIMAGKTGHDFRYQIFF